MRTQTSSALSGEDPLRSALSRDLVDEVINRLSSHSEETSVLMADTELRDHLAHILYELLKMTKKTNEDLLSLTADARQNLLIELVWDPSEFLIVIRTIIENLREGANIRKARTSRRVRDTLDTSDSTPSTIMH